MSVSWEKVRLVGQLFLRSCPTGRTLVYYIIILLNKQGKILCLV